MNFFEIARALLPRHAQHVVLVHFPIALFMTGVAFDLVARWKRSQALASAAYYNLLLAAVSVVPVFATGVLAWQWQLEGARLTGNLLLHLIFAAASGVMICAVTWLHVRARRKGDDRLPTYHLPIELLTVALVAVTGHLGGFLSGVNG